MEGELLNPLTRPTVAALLLGAALAMAGCTPAAPAPTTAPPEAPKGKPAEAAKPVAAPASPAASPAAGESKPVAALPPGPLKTFTVSLPSLTAGIGSILIAEREGFLARQGVKLEYTLHQGGPPALQAMMADAADATLQITGTTVNAIANGADIAIVAGYQVDPDYQLWARPEIGSVNELAGKRVASADPGSELNTITKRILSFYGLTPEKYDIAPVGATGARYAALTQGAVEATLLSAPVTFDAEARGFKLLGSSAEAIPQYMFGTMATKRDWARQNSDTLVRFLRGYQDALDWIEDPANKAKVVEHWADIAKTNPEAAAKTYELYVTGPLKDKMLSKKAGVSLEGMKAVVDMMTEGGILKRPVSIDELLDLSYLEQASKR